MHLLGLLNGCDLAGTNGPNGLVGDDDRAEISHRPKQRRRIEGSLPVGRVNLLGNSLQLALDNILGLAALALLEGLSNARNDTETSTNSGAHLVRDELVGVAEEGAALRVTEDDPVHVGVFELVGRDLAGEGTARLGEAVLRGYLGRGLQRRLYLQEVQRRGGDDHFCNKSALCF